MNYNVYFVNYTDGESFNFGSDFDAVICAVNYGGVSYVEVDMYEDNAYCASYTLLPEEIG